MHCDLDLWPFDLKIYRAHPCLMGSLHVKFHDDRCKGKAVMRRKPKCGRTDGWTDGRTDGHGDSSIPPPPNFIAGGIIKVLGSDFNFFFYDADEFYWILLIILTRYERFSHGSSNLGQNKSWTESSLLLGDYRKRCWNLFGHASHFDWFWKSCQSEQ